MLRLAMRAMLFAGLFLVPVTPAAAEPVCVTVTVTITLTGTTLSYGPFCAPYDGPTTCGQQVLTVAPPALAAVLVAYCIPA
jgi:hypothetical protein